MSKFNKEFQDLIKVDWKTQQEVARELREELKEFEKKCREKRK